MELGKKKAKKDIRTETEANKMIQITQQHPHMIFQKFTVTKTNPKGACRLMSINFLSLKPGEFSIPVNPAFMRQTPACTATVCDVKLNTRNHYAVFLGKKEDLNPM